MCCAAAAAAAADCETLPRNTNRFVRVTCTTVIRIITGYRCPIAKTDSLERAYSRNACLVLRDRGSRWRRSNRERERERGYSRTTRSAGCNLETLWIRKFNRAELLFVLSKAYNEEEEEEGFEGCQGKIFSSTTIR